MSSGKGGVGKSTTAVNIAATLRLQGAKVGLLDANSEVFIKIATAINATFMSIAE